MKKKLTKGKNKQGTQITNRLLKDRLYTTSLSLFFFFFFSSFFFFFLPFIHSFLLLFFSFRLKRPNLECAVVLVGHKQVADAVDALVAQLGALERKVAQVGFGQALDKILLHAAGCRHNHVHHPVLRQIPQRLPQPFACIIRSPKNKGGKRQKKKKRKKRKKKRKEREEGGGGGGEEEEEKKWGEARDKRGKANK